ncbi:MAG: IS4 family transposase [Victivallaceae bacterium]|nr:IS4 family transposase [Victivallaceae bacterium]
MSNLNTVRLTLDLMYKVSLKEVLRCLLEGARWLPKKSCSLTVSAKSSISKARTRLGVAPLKALFEKVAKPAATRHTRGAWFKQWHLVGIDGSTLELPDEVENVEEFGRPPASRGKTAYPRMRFVALFEIGTKIVFSVAAGKYEESEKSLALKAIPKLRSGMLCIADRYYSTFNLFRAMRDTEADLLVRARKNVTLPCLKRFRDGSFLSEVYPDLKHKRRGEKGLRVRVIEYVLKDFPDAEEKYILITTILDPKSASAKELAALYHERREVEIAYAELKVHLKEPGQNLRSKRPDLVIQEFYGFMLAHYVIRSVMHHAALKADEDPDKLSFVHAVRVIRRKINSMNIFSLD